MARGYKSDRLFRFLRNDGERQFEAGEHIIQDPFLSFVYLPRQSSSQTLQQAQTNALLTLLNLNESTDPSVPKDSSSLTGKTQALNVPAPSGPAVWKVLVLDQFTKDVIATVLRVQDLRDVGVTLHVCVFFNSPRFQLIPSLWILGNCILIDRRSLMSLLYTSSHQRCKTSGE